MWKEEVVAMWMCWADGPDQFKICSTFHGEKNIFPFSQLLSSFNIKMTSEQKKTTKHSTASWYLYVNMKSLWAQHKLFVVECGHVEGGLQYEADPWTDIYRWIVI